MRTRYLLLAALLLAVVGYFGPWSWHPAVAFRYAADDLAEFVRFMPAVQSGQVPITRELFFLPIWLAAFGLALWIGSHVRSRRVRFLAGLLIVYASIWPMPRYPFILDAYRSPEFAASFWISVIVAAACVAALNFGARLSDPPRLMTWIGIGLAGASLAPLHFVRLKPALDQLHGWPLEIGWGIFATVLGFLAVAALGAWQMWRKNRPGRFTTPAGSPSATRR